MVGDLVVEGLEEGQFPGLDQVVDILGEVVHILSDLGIVGSEVGGYGLVASGAGHDHVLRTHSVGLLDYALCAFEGVGGVSGPQKRGAAAPLVCTEYVHLDACPVQDADSGLGDLLLPEGSGASCEEDDVGLVVFGYLCGPPVSSVCLVSAVRVVDLADLLAHSLVCGKGPYAVLDHPGPYGLPELYEGDVGVADGFAVSAAGAFVHRIDEVGVEGSYPSQRFVQGSGDVYLVEIVDFTPGGVGLPRSLPVSLAYRDAVTALYTCGQILLNVREF